METIVELINNPYTQRLQILINGEAISVYSNLEKYVDEPFYDWCERILDDIFEECNQSKFCLHFCSRQEEIAVMEKIIRNYPNCTQYMNVGKFITAYVKISFKLAIGLLKFAFDLVFRY